MNILVVAIDGWHSGYVGAYGNTHLATPEIDRCAAEGAVFDQAFAVSEDLDAVYGALWGGDGAIGTPKADAASSLAARFAAAGFKTELLTDDPLVGEHRLAAFAERTVHPYVPAERLANEPVKTHLYDMFSLLGERLAAAAERAEPFLLWAHFRGLAGAWDAPYELRRQFAEEDDPEPPRFAVCEPRRLAADVDPDELLGVRQAYAGQIALLDMCLGGLAELIDDCGLSRRTLVVLLSTRGFPLGEHGRIGYAPAVDDESDLCEELMHIPWIMRFPEARFATVRVDKLVHQADLPPTLCEACEVAPLAHNPGDDHDSSSLLPLVLENAATWRDHLCFIGRGEQAIRTDAWFLRRAASGRMRLFAKPEDRWEVNDVAMRCEEAADGLSAAIDQRLQATEANATPAPLDEFLRERTE